MHISDMDNTNLANANEKEKREGRSRTSMTLITATLHSMMQTKGEH
jgi:hypothetical protein